MCIQTHETSSIIKTRGRDHANFKTESNEKDLNHTNCETKSVPTEKQKKIKLIGCLLAWQNFNVLLDGDLLKQNLAKISTLHFTFKTKNKQVTKQALKLE